MIIHIYHNSKVPTNHNVGIKPYLDYKKMDYFKLSEKRSMTTEKLVKILGRQGTIVSIEKAELILELVYKLSNLSVKETLSKLPELSQWETTNKFKRHRRKSKKYENS